MDETWKRYVKVIGATPKISHIGWFYLYEISRIGRHRARNSINGSQWLTIMGNWEWLLMDSKFYFGVMKCAGIK